MDRKWTEVGPAQKWTEVCYFRPTSGTSLSSADREGERSGPEVGHFTYESVRTVRTKVHDLIHMTSYTSTLTTTSFMYYDYLSTWEVLRHLKLRYTAV